MNVDKANLYITAPQLRRRYAISESTFWRWEHDPSVAFPKPLRVGRKKLYSVVELEEWEASKRDGG